MEENKKQGEVKTEKLSYEQLENVASQLQQQNMQLRRMIDSNEWMFKRLEYLFKVMEVSHMFTDGFVARCSSEIEELMILPEEDENPKKD